MKKRCVNMGKLIGWLALAISPALIFVPYASAQYLTGSIVGVVSDQSGANVPGAHVIVTNQSTGLTHAVTTDAGGRYSAVDLAEGIYTITVEATGFATVPRQRNCRRPHRSCRDYSFLRHP